MNTFVSVKSNEQMIYAYIMGHHQHHQRTLIDILLYVTGTPFKSIQKATAQQRASCGAHYITAYHVPAVLVLCQ